MRESHPLIINVAPTGMVPTKERTPHVPVSVDEILDDVARCSALGASIIHVHPRDENGVPTHRSDYFAPIIEGIREIDPDLVVCATCSGRRGASLEQRAEVLDLSGNARPDMGSLTLGSNNFHGEASMNPPEVIEALAERMRLRGIQPELEAFEPGMVQFGRHLAHKGVLEEPCYVNILLGNVATAPLSLSSLAAFLALVPDQWIWALAGIGREQIDANLMAIAAGGHVRVGLEDNIWWDRGRTRAATNGELVARVTSLAELAERPIASPASVREQLKMPRAARAGSAQPA